MEIMLVDDDGESLGDLVRMLEAAGHRCRTFLSLETALAGYSPEFDAVITELKKPEPNGLELLRLIRGRNPRAKVIILTGYGDAAAAIAAVNSGVYAFLRKPVRASELMAALQEIASEEERRRREIAEHEKLSGDYRRMKKAYDDVVAILNAAGGEFAVKAPAQE